MKIKITLALLAFIVGISTLRAQTKETRNVSTFTKISFRVPGKLFMTQGNTQKVEIEGDTEALKKIETEVEGGKLIIKQEGDSWNWGSNNEKFNIYITVKNIEAISVSGSGNLVGQNKFSVANLDLDVSGSGSLQVEADATGDVEADISGSGSLDLKASCKNYSGDVTGSGKIIVAATISEKSDFDISGSGTIRASGSAKEAKVNITGSGELQASDLEVGICRVRISGSGEVEINVKDDLDANISGSGTVYYKGNPSHVNGHSSGSGHVKKM